jgi:protein TonB
LVEPTFPGGEDAWRNYLRKTLDPTVPAVNNSPDGKYTIIMKFVVNPDGTLSEIKPDNDPGYGMVEEARRVLKMQKWLPAIRYGIYQRVYRLQPITFLIEGQGR